MMICLQTQDEVYHKTNGTRGVGGARPLKPVMSGGVQL